MWLFDTILAKRAAALASLGFLALTAGCQVQPLYGSAQTGATLSSVAISEPTSRVEQVTRNELVFMLTGGAGEPANPAYSLDLHVTSTGQDVLIDKTTGNAHAGRLTVNAVYTLNKAGSVVARGSRSITALLDYPGQQFARIRAVRDAEDRAAKEVAELVRADLAVALHH